MLIRWRFPNVLLCFFFFHTGFLVLQHVSQAFQLMLTIHSESELASSAKPLIPFSPYFFSVCSWVKREGKTTTRRKQLHSSVRPSVCPQPYRKLTRLTQPLAHPTSAACRRSPGAGCTMLEPLEKWKKMSTESPLGPKWSPLAGPLTSSASRSSDLDLQASGFELGPVMIIRSSCRSSARQTGTVSAFSSEWLHLEVRPGEPTMQ